MVAAGERAKFSELVRCFVMHRCFSFLPSTFPSACARCLDYIHDAALLNTTLPILCSPSFVALRHARNARSTTPLWIPFVG